MFSSVINLILPFSSSSPLYSHSSAPVTLCLIWSTVNLMYHTPIKKFTSFIYDSASCYARNHYFSISWYSMWIYVGQIDQDIADLNKNVTYLVFDLTFIVDNFKIFSFYFPATDKSLSLLYYLKKTIHINEFIFMRSYHRKQLLWAIKFVCKSRFMAPGS